MSGAADIGVVIVAGGSGSRANLPGGELKQFRWVAGKPMLLHSLQLFHDRTDVAMVVCVLPRESAGDPPPWIFQCDTERMLVTAGGATRAESVRHGLEDLPAQCRYVLVHDAARPLVPAAMVNRVVDEMRKGRAVVPVLPVVDTIKSTDAEGRIVRTEDRRALRRAQTPQGFPRDVILRAHESAIASGRDGTDDASLCEAIGLDVYTVRGSERAIKVTEERDFARVEALMGLAE